MVWFQFYHYSAIHSTGQDTKFTVEFSFFMYGYRFLSQRFTDRHKILNGGSTWSQTGHLPFWGDSLRDGRVMGINRGHMARYASCWSSFL